MMPELDRHLSISMSSKQVGQKTNLPLEYADITCIRISDFPWQTGITSERKSIVHVAIYQFELLSKTFGCDDVHAGGVSD